MLIAGLTGGIASGKSLVARVFKKLGAHLIDADRIVHELLEPGQTANQEVLDHFGDVILLRDKCVDRRKLGEIVFNDAEKRAWLNRCMHPKVFAAFHAQVNHIRDRQPAALIIFDAVLLIETGYYRNMDKTIVVYAEEEQQIARLLLRDGFTREHAIARIRSQMPLAQKRAYADYVINNTGAPENAERQAIQVYRSLIQDEIAIRSSEPA